jgi:hypothetical protein
LDAASSVNRFASVALSVKGFSAKTCIFFSKNYSVENVYLFDLKKKFKFFLTKYKKNLNKNI